MEVDFYLEVCPLCHRFPGTCATLRKAVARAAPWATLEGIIEEEPGLVRLIVHRKRWARWLGRFWWRYTLDRTHKRVFTAVAEQRPAGIWYAVHVEK